MRKLIRERVRDVQISLLIISMATTAHVVDDLRWQFMALTRQAVVIKRARETPSGNIMDLVVHAGLHLSVN